jgi:hypothetical protein
MDGAGSTEGVTVNMADLIAYTTPVCGRYAAYVAAAGGGVATPLSASTSQAERLEEDQVQPKGACIQGVCGIFLTDGCAKMAVNNGQQLCKKYDFDAYARAVCVNPGTTKVHARGLCGKHDFDARVVCVHPGCTTKAHAHGQQQVKYNGGVAKALCCVHSGCIPNSVARGCKHGAYESANGVCVHPGCTTKSQSRGLCGKHGGGTPKAMCAQPIPPTNELHDTLHTLETHLPLHWTQTHLDALAVCASMCMPNPPPPPTSGYMYSSAPTPISRDDSSHEHSRPPSPEPVSQHRANSSRAERHHINAEFTVKAEFTGTDLPSRTPNGSAWSEVLLAMSAKERNRVSKKMKLSPNQHKELTLSSRKYKQQLAQRKFKKSKQQSRIAIEQKMVRTIIRNNIMIK